MIRVWITSLRLTARNFAANRWRFVLSAIAVCIGTALISGSLAFSSTLESAYRELTLAETENVDIRVEHSDGLSPGVPVELGRELEELPEVDRVEPLIQQPVAIVDSAGIPIPTIGRPTQAGPWLAPDEAVRTQFDILEGRPPATAGEALVPEPMALANGFELGDEITIVTASRGVVPVLIVGLLDAPTHSSNIALTPDHALDLFTDGVHVPALDVVAAPEIENTNLRAAIAGHASGYTLTMGESLDSTADGQGLPLIEFISYFLIAIGAVSLLVGSFTIFNTFAMIVSQRQRELGLLRAIGFSRRDIYRSIMAEAALIGTVGSVAGTVLGFVFTGAMLVGLSHFGIAMPTSTPDITPPALVLSMTLGVATTLLAAWHPARRAGSVAPVEAIRRAEVGIDHPDTRKTVLGYYLLVSGLLFVGISVLEDDTVRAVSNIGIAGGLLVAGTYLVLPSLVSPLTRGMERLTAPFAGRLGQIGSRNARRLPARTANTAFSLALGMIVIAAFGTAATSARDSLGTAVDQGLGADIIITPLFTTGIQLSLPDELPDRLLATAGVDSIVTRSEGAGYLNGKPERIPSVQGNVEEVIDADHRAGSLNPGPAQIVVSHATALERGWSLGSRLTVQSYMGESQSLTVSGIYGQDRLFGDWYTGMDTYRLLVPEEVRTTSSFFVQVDRQASPEQVRDRIVGEIKDSPMMMVQTREQLLETANTGINQLIALIYATLSLAVLVAVLGVTNSLALAAIERRREITLLRSLGVQRRQVRWLFCFEGAQVMAIGTLCGTALGFLIGIFFVRSLSAEGLEILSVPAFEVASINLVILIVGTVAAMIPAAVASRSPRLVEN